MTTLSGLPATLPLELVAAFGRALAHKLRTPLSVITNDLSFLQTQLAPGECARSLERSREIAELLRRVCDGNDGVLKVEECALGELLPRSWKVSGVVSRVRVDSVKMIRAFALLDECLATLTRGQIDVGEIGSSSAPSLRLVLAVEDSTRARISSKEFQCFTSLMNECLGRDLIFPPLVDALLLAHKCGISIGIVDRKLNATITIPGL